MRVAHQLLKQRHLILPLSGPPLYSFLYRLRNLSHFFPLSNLERLFLGSNKVQVGIDTYKYSGTSDNGHCEKRTTSVKRANCLPPTNCSIQGITSEIGTTSLQWTRGLSPLCPLFRGSTVYTHSRIQSYTHTHTHTHTHSHILSYIQSYTHTHTYMSYIQSYTHTLTHTCLTYRTTLK